MTTTTNQTVRPPKQQRSRESYERVLDAAHGLLEENGFEGFTVQEVAARANVSVGAIYERFGNKETLLRTVHARLMDTMAQFDSADELVEPANASEVIEVLVRRVAATMGEEAFAAAWAAGRSLPLKHAVVYAIEDAEAR